MTVSPKQCQPLNSENILLTGATGVLGAHLLRELLRQTKSHIYCLVREDTRKPSKERLLNYLKIYDTQGELEQEFHKRATVLEGDISKVDLHWDKKLYDELTKKIDATIHAAASTNLFSDFKSIEAINVGGTKNIVNFCLKTKQRYICFVSSYSIMGDKTFEKDFHFKETHFDVEQGFEGFPYQETKYIAEKFIRESTEEGLLWNVVRPGQIYGDSETGAYPLSKNIVGAFFYDIFKTMVLAQIIPVSEWKFDVTPVNYVSQATIELGLKRPSIYETYHLTNPHIQFIYDSIKIFKELGYPMEDIDVGDFINRIKNDKLFVNGRPLKSITTRIFKLWAKGGFFNFKDSASVDSEYTVNILKKAEIHCARIDADLMGTYVEAGIREGFFPALPEKKRSVI